MYTYIPIAECRNEDDDNMCTYWASIGECSTNAQYMMLKCFKACNCGVQSTTVSLYVYFYYQELFIFK